MRLRCLKVYWLAVAAGASLCGIFFVSFPCSTVKILQPMVSKGRCLKKCSKACCLIVCKEKTTGYTQLTLLSQPSFAFTGGNMLFLRFGGTLPLFFVSFSYNLHPYTHSIHPSAAFASVWTTPHPN